LVVLDLKHNLDDTTSNRAESIHTHSRGNDRDRLDRLSTELLVLHATKLTQILDKEAHGLLEVRYEIFANFLNKCAKSGSCVLLCHGVAILYEKTELLGE